MYLSRLVIHLPWKYHFCLFHSAQDVCSLPRSWALSGGLPLSRILVLLKVASNMEVTVWVQQGGGESCLAVSACPGGYGWLVPFVHQPWFPQLLSFSAAAWGLLSHTSYVWLLLLRNIFPTYQPSALTEAAYLMLSHLLNPFPALACVPRVVCYGAVSPWAQQFHGRSTEALFVVGAAAIRITL